MSAGGVKMKVRGFIADVVRAATDEEWASSEKDGLPLTPLSVTSGWNARPRTASRSLRLVTLADPDALQKALATMSPLPRAQSSCSCAVPVASPANGFGSSSGLLEPPAPVVVL